MDYTVQLNTLWVLLGTALVFFMRAGFAMLEAGYTRAKNSGNIIMKNLMIFACGSIAYWLIGYRLMFGVSEGEIPIPAHAAFNTMLCATAAIIVSGAMAERTQWKVYLIYSVTISAFVYPVAASWVWGGGWLSALSMGKAAGFTDQAGSALVHMTGGIAALVGAKMLGPRIGKYGKNGKTRAIPGHSITLGALGVFILWFGWFGFNMASNYALSNAKNSFDVSNVFMTTNIAAVASTAVTMIVTWTRYKKPDVFMTLNGSLAGLVAITAGCSVMDPWASALTGAIAGILVVIGVEFIEKVLKIDDPVGAIGVHGISGMFGALACGLFSRDTGYFTTGDPGQLAVQVIGVLAIAAWVGTTMTILFVILKKTIGLRVPLEEEIAGLDSAENGLLSMHTGFLPSSAAFPGADRPETGKSNVSEEEAVPVQFKTYNHPAMSEAKLTKVEILMKQSKFEALKLAMNAIGVTGMTVTQVLGCGMQKGATEYYRGVTLDEEMMLLPKIKVEIVIAKVPVSEVVKAAKRVLYSGHIGDGKIFIYDVENVVKVRTGEEGYNALQGVDE